MVSALLLALQLAAPRDLPDRFHLQWVAERHGVPAGLFQALAWVESQDNLQVGKAHACTALEATNYCAWGRFQLKLATASRYCKLDRWRFKRYGPNVECAAVVLTHLRRECGSWRCAVMHYYNPSEGPAAQAYQLQVFAVLGVQALGDLP